MTEQELNALEAAIMNIPAPAVVEAMGDEDRFAYKEGHRDARHAAVELVRAALSRYQGKA